MEDDILASTLLKEKLLKRKLSKRRKIVGTSNQYETSKPTAEKEAPEQESGGSQNASTNNPDSESMGKDIKRRPVLPELPEFNGITPMETENLPDGNSTPSLSDQQLGWALRLGVVTALLNATLPIDLTRLEQETKEVLPSSCRVRWSRLEAHVREFGVNKAVEMTENFELAGKTLMMVTKVDRKSLLEEKSKCQEQVPNFSLKQSQSEKHEDGRHKGHQLDLQSLLSAKTAKEKVESAGKSELSELLRTPSAHEKNLEAKFKSTGGSKVRTFCQELTKEKCASMSPDGNACGKLHFRKVVFRHTEESLGDCSFLDTCRYMHACRYRHYEIDDDEVAQTTVENVRGQVTRTVSSDLASALLPPQWINIDVRKFDYSVLGKFSVVMADPPWDIHMDLPYGTMKDDEMRALPVGDLVDDGVMFLWVTSRAMELGRELFTTWGVAEIIWVKTNQLQRCIRTGRTGHWLNHSKEHCLVGIKGTPDINANIDCDVIVSEVRETSRKPDEIYGLIERLAPGTRKLEIFGRPHNLTSGWITMGNQLNGSMLFEEDVRERFRKSYPNLQLKPDDVDEFIAQSRQQG